MYTYVAISISAPTKPLALYIKFQKNTKTQSHLLDISPLIYLASLIRNTTLSEEY